MNICKCLKCETCDTKIDCRIGMSNRDIQPFQFGCPVCDARITFTLTMMGEKTELTGAQEQLDFKGPFKGDNPFIDLHLDFPASFGNYQLGMTTFMKVTSQIGPGYAHLNQRLEILNMLYQKQNDLRNLITQYKRRDIKSFAKACRKIPRVNLASEKQEDVLAALYSATSVMSSPFTIFETNEEISKKGPSIFMWLHQNHKEKTNIFVDKILTSGFVKNLHNDCLSLYPRLVSMDLPFRPALFYDYIPDAELGKVAGRVSNADFQVCSDYYKDMAEVFSRQITLLAGLNNLLKRGDSNQFHQDYKTTKANKPRQETSSLDAYANVDLGSKLDFIDDNFYKINADAIDNQLRNGIAHYKYEYQESTQVITYYPKKEGMERQKLYEISFMQFLIKSLHLFREIHSVNHIVKALLFYIVIILKKNIWK